MAIKGTIVGPKVKDLWLTFEWNRTATNIEKNTSIISWTMKLNRINSLTFSADKPYTLTINESDKSGVYTNNIDWGDGSQHSAVIASGSMEIAHEPDGYKSFSVDAVFYIAVNISGTQVASISLSGKQTLDNIPRATTPTVSPSTGVKTGDTVKIGLNRASSVFTHTVTYSFGKSNGTIGKDLTTSVSWTIPRALANQIPNSSSGICVITCKTYNGDKLIGSKSVNLTISANEKDIPVIESVTISESVSGLAQKFKAYIQGKSKLNINIEAKGVYGSTIKKYETRILNITYNKADFTSEFLSDSGSVNIMIKVTDSRNRTGSVTKTVDVLAYNSPKIELFSPGRANSSGLEDNEGTYLKALIRFNIASLNNLNDKSYKIEYRIQGTTQWSLIGSGAEYSLDKTYVSSSGLLNTDNPYTVRLTVSDYFGSDEYAVDIPTGFTLIDYHESGTGIAFGKVAESPDLFDVNLPARFRKDVIIESEWIELEIDSAFKTYSDLDTNKPKIKNIAGHVEIKGALSPVTQYTASAARVTMARGIPPNLRPNTDRVFLCIGSNKATWECTVTTTGEIMVARYGTTEYGAVSTASRLIFSVSYNI